MVASTSFVGRLFQKLVQLTLCSLSVETSGSERRRVLEDMSLSNEGQQDLYSATARSQIFHNSLSNTSTSWLTDRCFKSSVVNLISKLLSMLLFILIDLDDASLSRIK